MGSKGLVKGLQKKKRSKLKPGMVKKVIMQARTLPFGLQMVFTITWMLFTGVRGGRELKKCNWAMCKLMKDKDGKKICWRFDPNACNEKNRQGGIVTWNVVRKEVDIHYVEGAAFNPGQIFEQYFNSQPKGYTDPANARCIFTHARRAYKEGQGFDDNECGHGWLDDVLERALKKQGYEGHWTNHQMRGLTIEGLRKSGIDSNNVKNRIGSLTKKIAKS